MNRKLIRTTLAEVKEREMHAQQTRRAPEAPVERPAAPAYDRHERPERAERPERSERSERPERPERSERPERPERSERPERPERSERFDRHERHSHAGAAGGAGAASSAASQSKKKIPPEQTNAESFYYKKQMDAHTPMVVVLQDNEQLAGTIEWYDKNSIKLHRKDGPNLLVLKHNIKYMYKDQSDDEE